MKIVIGAAIALTFIIGNSACKPPVPSENSTDANPEALVSAYFETFNKHDASALGLFYADSCDMKDPSLGTAKRRMSATDISKKYADMFAYFKTLKDSVIATYPSGNCITVEFISIGTLPDSSKLYLPICTVFEFKDRKIIKDFTYYNNANE